MPSSMPTGGREPPDCSREGAADEAPIFDRVLLARDNLQCDFVVAGGEERGDAVVNFLIGPGDRCQADQAGGDERPLLGLDKHQMSAMVFEVMRALRPEAPRQFDIPGNNVDNRGASGRRARITSK